MKNEVFNLHELWWTYASFWAKDNIILEGKPFSLARYPFLVELYARAAVDEEIVIRKAAQMGFTTWGIITTLWYLINPIFNKNALYVFPTFTKASDFSQARFKPLVEGSPGPANYDFDIDNVGLKRFGGRVLYFRGTENPRQITELPAAWIVMDEVDEFKDSALVKKIKLRASGAMNRWFKYISTPTTPNFGIDALYLKSSMARWHVRCDHCSRWQELDFFKNIDLDHPERGTFCAYCKKSINRLGPGRWVHGRKSKVSGYWISQLYSPTVSINELVEEWRDIRGEIDRQIFYNMRLGLPYIPKGGQLSEAELLRACGNWENGDRLEGDYFMGIDVGNRLHWVIVTSEDKVAAYGAVETFEELARIISEWDVFFFVIDALPEKRKALELCREFEGRGAVCYYKESEGDREIEDNIKQFNRDREVWLDAMFSMIKARKIRLPRDLDDEFREHLTALIRVAQKNNKGQRVIKYLEYGKPDHYAHALNYALIAKASFKPPRIRFI